MRGKTVYTFSLKSRAEFRPHVYSIAGPLVERKGVQCQIRVRVVEDYKSWLRIPSSWGKALPARMFEALMVIIGGACAAP